MADVEPLHEHAAAFLYARGGVVIPPSREPGAVVHVPFALLPRQFPSKLYYAARALAQPFNELVDAIARQPDWLFEVLERRVWTGAGDAFTGRLLDIARAVVAEGVAQPYYFGIHRSDYMIDEGHAVAAGAGVHAAGTGAAAPPAVAETSPPAVDSTATESDGPRLRQIELNTVSSAFAGLSARIARLHRYLLQRFAVVHNASGGPGPALRALAPSLQPYCAAMQPAVSASARSMPAGATNLPPSLWNRFLPQNDCDVGVGDAMAAAHFAYGVPSAVVLFVVQPGERNILDQRALEHAMWERHGVRVRRCTLEWLAAHGRLGPGGYAGGAAAAAAVGAGSTAGAGAGGAGASAAAAGHAVPRDRCLLIDAEFSAGATRGSAGDSAGVAAEESVTAAGGAEEGSAAAADEVSVVYYRSGYSPGDFISEACWAAKLLAERSAAVKCPPILYHLAGTKKVQQALAGRGQVERFLPAAAAAAVRACFAGLWSLDAAERDAEAAAAIADAFAHPDRYVVKPQREGGGNNLFGPAVRVALAGVAGSASASAAAPSKAEDPGASGAEKVPSVALIGAASPAIDGIATAATASANASSAASAGGSAPASGGSSAAVPDAPMGKTELAAHILMERVFAPVAPALLCRLGAVVAAPAVCELGIYGVFLGNGRGAPIRNACVGHLLRTKAEGTDEGGVAAGYAVLDSPFLVD